MTKESLARTKKEGKDKWVKDRAGKSACNAIYEFLFDDEILKKFLTKEELEGYLKRIKAYLEEYLKPRFFEIINNQENSQEPPLKDAYYDVRYTISTYIQINDILNRIK